MCKFISKAISIDSANKWLDAIVCKAIDIGEVITHYVGCEDIDGTILVKSYTSYDVSDNLTITVFSDFIAVVYYGKTKTLWRYHLTR